MKDGEKTEEKGREGWLEGRKGRKREEGGGGGG